MIPMDLSVPSSGWPLVGTLAFLVIGSSAFGNWVTKVTPQRTSKGDQIGLLNARMDKLVSDHSAQLTALEAKYEERVAGVEKKLTMQVAHSHDLEDYVEELRAHISDGKPAPPPDWPPGVRS